MTTKSRARSREDDFTDPESLTLQDYWRVLVRRRWYLLGPFFFIGLLGFGVARFWPELYRSEALILVEQQRVPDQYVTPNVIISLQARLDAVTQIALSRTRLENLIKNMNLFQAEFAHGVSLGDVVDMMRKRIAVQWAQTPGRAGDLTGFRISYSASDPKTAQDVTARLSSFFVDQNIESRTGLSRSTTEFLESQLESARKELEAQELRLRRYKEENYKSLPEQQQANLQILNSLEAQLRNATDSLARAEQQKIYLESLRSEYEALSRSTTAPQQAEGKPPELVSAEAALIDLQRQLGELTTRLKPTHPDIVRLREQIDFFEGVRKKFMEERAIAGKKTAEISSSAAARQPTLIEVDSRLKAIIADIQKQNNDIASLNSNISNVRALLQLSPEREQQLAKETRDYENSRANYQTLFQKKLQSSLATDLESAQQGEKFRILDSASMPEKPDWPNRAQITIYGWLLGLALGVGLMAVVHRVDQTVWAPKDLTAFTDVLILTRIPVLLSPRQQVRKKWRRVGEAALAGLLLLASIGTAFQTYMKS